MNINVSTRIALNGEYEAIARDYDEMIEGYMKEAEDLPLGDRLEMHANLAAQKRQLGKELEGLRKCCATYDVVVQRAAQRKREIDAIGTNILLDSNTFARQSVALIMRPTMNEIKREHEFEQQERLKGTPDFVLRALGNIACSRREPPNKTEVREYAVAKLESKAARLEPEIDALVREAEHLAQEIDW